MGSWNRFFAIIQKVQFSLTSAYYWCIWKSSKRPLTHHPHAGVWGWGSIQKSRRAGFTGRRSGDVDSLMSRRSIGSNSWTKCRYLAVVGWSD